MIDITPQLLEARRRAIHPSKGPWLVEASPKNERILRVGWNLKNRGDMFLRELVFRYPDMMVTTELGTASWIVCDEPDYELFVRNDMPFAITLSQMQSHYREIVDLHEVVMLSIESYYDEVYSVDGSKVPEIFPLAGWTADLPSDVPFSGFSIFDMRIATA